MSGGRRVSSTDLGGPSTAPTAPSMSPRAQQCAWLTSAASSAASDLEETSEALHGAEAKPPILSPSKSIVRRTQTVKQFMQDDAKARDEGLGI